MSIHFDEAVNPNADIGKLRPMLIYDYLCETENDLRDTAMEMNFVDLVKAMGAVDGHGDPSPLNAGLLFFNERPDNFFRYARIEIVDKPDPTGEGMTENMFTGPLNRQLKDALSFIRNYIIRERIFKYPDQAEAGRFFNYPYEAIEEILVNAVYHKSYRIPKPITVVFTPEGVEIVSCPGPDRSISDKDLKDGKLNRKFIENRRIGEMLKALKMTECASVGIPRAIRALEKNGSGKPLFRTDAERRYLSVFIPIHPVFLRDHIGCVNFDKAFKSVRKPRPYRERSDLRDEIIHTLRKEDMALSKLSKKLGYTKITANVRTAVSELMEEGRIVHTIPETPTNKKQQLRLV
jgi:ATP-dependent DNA helicase RecG